MSDYVCIRDEQLQGQSRKIAELDAELRYKKERLDELKDDNKEMKETLNDIKKSVNEIILASERDDSKLKDIISQQDNRITALETTNKTLKWVIGIGLSGLSVGVAFLAFLITHMH